jgi:hypothetical protein
LDTPLRKALTVLDFRPMQEQVTSDKPKHPMLKLFGAIAGIVAFLAGVAQIHQAWGTKSPPSDPIPDSREHLLIGDWVFTEDTDLPETQSQLRYTLQVNYASNHYETDTTHVWWEQEVTDSTVACSFTSTGKWELSGDRLKSQFLGRKIGLARYRLNRQDDVDEAVFTKATGAPTCSRMASQTPDGAVFEEEVIELTETTLTVRRFSPDERE